MKVFASPWSKRWRWVVPIVAYASSAIGETVADAGVVRKRRNPYLLAETLDRLMRQSLSADLCVKGRRRRYQEKFTNQKIEETFLQAMSGVL